MSDEKLDYQNDRFERRDLSASGVLRFFAGLAIVGVSIFLMLGGMYRFLNRYEKMHESAPNPLVGATNVDTRNPTPQDADKFPLPRLETNERVQLDDQRLREDQTLNTYGWLDQSAGVAHIPIERAMALIVERGLPTVPPHSATGTQRSTETQRQATQNTTKATGNPHVKQ